MRTIVWILAAAFLALITIALSQRGALDPLRNLVLTVVSPLERGVGNAAEPVADVLDRIAERQDLEEENSQLRQQIEQRGAGGMVVMSAGSSLVGVVSAALDDFAWVTLITDPNSSVNAMVMESRTQGVVSGTLHAGLKMELLPQEEVVQPGSTVATSGLGGNFPDALLIGEVVSVQGSPQDIFQKAEVEPAADLTRLETVLVLTSFQPARLTPTP